jgi:CheY-like chemotaxis protein
VTEEARYEAFVQAVREALQHLYKPVKLLKSPLGALYAADAARSPLALQDLLLQGIEALRPKAGTSPDSKGWRSYHALHSRYSDQFSQTEVAKSLGLSPRQLLRQENEALQNLAVYLWTHYGLAERPEVVDAIVSAGRRAEDLALRGEVSRSQELAWVRESAPSELVALGELMTEILGMLRPVMEDLGVTVEVGCPLDLPIGLARRSPLRAALISLLMTAARSVPGGRLSVVASAVGVGLCLALRASPDLAATGQAGSAAESDSLAMAGELVSLSGGELALDPGGPAATFGATIVLPVAERAFILCVDDNVDTLTLYERALSDTRYVFRGTRDPQQVEALAQELRPAAIVMDIMLPDIDGWELLGRLRSHPSTRRIPVIVCSILPEEGLALALGAAAFARKPLGRDVLLVLLAGIIET